MAPPEHENLALEGSMNADEAEHEGEQSPVTTPHRHRLFKIVERVQSSNLKVSDRARVYETTVIATGHRVMPHKDYFFDGEDLVYAVNAHQVDRITGQDWTPPQDGQRVWRQEIQDEFIDFDAYVTPGRRSRS
jgi:hypothetical protein